MISINMLVFPLEFKMILEQVGFQDIIISADYKYGEYPTNGAETITFEAIANK